MISDIRTVILRELASLEKEISAFDERRLWEVKGSITNPAGNLALHLVGNLNHFIGAGIGKNGYVRQRELEFSSRDIPAEKLIAMIRATSEMVGDVLNRMKESELDEPSSFPKQDREVNNRFLLIHLVAHLNYHLGQINYLRRLQ